jgi:hypothetical protein
VTLMVTAIAPRDRATRCDMPVFCRYCLNFI